MVEINYISYLLVLFAAGLLAFVGAFHTLEIIIKKVTNTNDRTILTAVTILLSAAIGLKVIVFLHGWTNG